MASHPGRLPKQFLTQVERSELPPAVVIGTGMTGLNIARPLRRHGVPVIGLDDARSSPTSHSSAFQFLQFDKLYDREVVGFLAELASILPRKAALFCSGDEHVTLLSHWGEELKEQYFFELPEPNVVDVLMNKNLFAQVAERNGWPVPQTDYCESMEELEAALPHMQFPVILKPRLKNRLSRTHSPQKTFRCSTPQELLANYRLLAQWEKEAVIQQWIPGGDDEIYFSFHYFDSELNELATFEGKKIRQHLPECGSTSCAVGVREPRVTELSRQILTQMRSIGFCSVEYKRDPRTDQLYIMEPTVGRVNLQVAVAIANNVDIVSRAFFHLIGRPHPPEPAPTHHVKWALMPHDLLSGRFYVHRGDTTWKEYFRSLSGPTVYAPLHPADYRLLFAFTRSWSAKLSRALGKRLRRTILRSLDRLVPQRAVGA